MRSWIWALLLWPGLGWAAPPEGLWRDEEGYFAIATGPCAPGAADLCGVIVGHHRSLQPHAGELCGLPVLWDFTEVEPGQWRGGQVLDPESEKIYGARLRLSPEHLDLAVAGFAQMRWPAVTSEKGMHWCPDSAFEGLEGW